MNRYSVALRGGVPQGGVGSQRKDNYFTELCSAGSRFQDNYFTEVYSGFERILLRRTRYGVALRCS